MSRSTIDKLTELKNLLDQGFLSPEEFEEARKALIAQSTGLGSAPAALSGQTRVEVASEVAADPLSAGHTSIDAPPNPTAPATVSTELPERLGNYKVLGELGAGGMGMVVRARHVEDDWARQQGGDVAIKLIHPHIAADDSFRKRFFAEAALGKRVQHESLATVYDVVSEGPWLGTILEFVDGEELTTHVKTDGITLEAVLALLRPLADVLDTLHEAGIVHRDLKPANVKVRPDGVPVLLDLGIAKDMSGSVGNETKTMTTMGTSAWMAPEQADAKNITGAADIYALGLIAYALLTGRLPWGSDQTEARVLANKLMGQLTPIEEVKPDLPASVARMIGSALSVSPKDRPATCAALVAGLQPEGDTEGEVGLVPVLDLEDEDAEEVATEVDQEGFAPEPDSSENENTVSPPPVPAPAPVPVEKDDEDGAGPSPASRLLLLIGSALLFVGGVGFLLMPDDAGDQSSRSSRGSASQQAAPLPLDARRTIVWKQLSADRTFNVGSSDGDRASRPVHSVYVSSFEMMHSEVTVEQYKACVTDGPCSWPDLSSVKSNDYCTYHSYGELAMNCVGWDQARQFCSWVDGRLPSEAEWEFAATSGGQGWRYPWGNQADGCERAVVALGDDPNSGARHADRRACGMNRVAEVCSKPMGNSTQGVCDLSGNLWEWTQDCDSDFSERCSSSKKIVRGGGFWSNRLQTRSTRRKQYSAIPQMDVGFRCVR